MLTRFPPRLRQAFRDFDRRVEAMSDAGAYYYFQPVEALDRATVVVDGAPKVMLATYSYLGLLRHPRVVAAACDAAHRYGTGTHGVRILGGTLDLHVRLEERLAELAGRDAAMTFSSGFVTNVATVAALMQPGDHILSDTMNHASIVDGCRLSGAAVRRYSHNDLGELERLLRGLPADGARMVVADAVFSMDGDVLPLPQVVELCRTYDALLMVDEAHSFGVLGDRGMGIEDHFGTPGAIDVKMGTLSKTLPGVGGFIAGDASLIRYLKHHARGFVFSAAMPPPVAAALLEALDVLVEEGEARRERLRSNVRRLVEPLRAAGFDLGATETTIVPVLVGDEPRTLALVKACQERGLLVLPVLYPAVPRAGSRLRINLTSDHTDEDIDRVVAVLGASGRALGLIP